LEKPFTNKAYVKPLKVISVRSPKTREKLINMGVECPQIYGDPLLMFPLVYNPIIKNLSKKIGIIPHYKDKKSQNIKFLVNDLVKYKYAPKVIDIEVGCNYKKFIDEIMQCEVIISSSLYGIIMGIIYKKKTILVEFSTKVIGNLFKFNDFFDSLNIKYKVKNTFNHRILQNKININLIIVKNITTNNLI